MRSSRGGLGDIPSLGKAGGPPASVRSRRAKAREEVAGWKSRPVRQRVIAAGPSLTSRDLTRNAGGRHRDRCACHGMRVHDCLGRGAAGLTPPGPGPAGDVQRRPSPVGGGPVGHWKWRVPSFSPGCWKSFPTDMLKMRRRQGSRHFQISKASFTEMDADPMGGNGDQLVGVLSRAQ
jgi:hypothetical protein